MHGRGPLTILNTFFHFATKSKNRKIKSSIFEEKIILPQELAQRLEWTTNSLQSARRNGTPFRHLLLYGKPGTGKTLFAKTLAKESGMDYAIMAGGDVGALGRDAVAELHKLFRWAKKSHRGVVVFVDEAEAFLRKGRGLLPGADGMSEELRNVLAAFLQHTGTETDKFCVVMATNVRGILDEAVMDRVDDEFEFPLPGLDERRKMLRMFLDEYIYNPPKAKRQITVDSVLDANYWENVVNRTAGFSGRQMAKLAIGLQAAVHGAGANVLTKGIADAVIDWKLNRFQEDADTLTGRTNK